MLREKYPWRARAGSTSAHILQTKLLPCIGFRVYYFSTFFCGDAGDGCGGGPYFPVLSL